MTTGRNFDGVLRVIDSLQLTAKHKVSTPAQWQQGEDVIISGSVSDDEVHVTLIDRSNGLIFGFSKLDVMFGCALPSAVQHPYRDIVKPRVQFVQTTVRSI